MSINNLIDDISHTIERYINKEMEQISAGRENIGLDNRCGSIYINEECIAVDKYNDRMLQYYGGFEYVDKEYRYELGDYVFYLASDDRVNGHIEGYFHKEDA